MKELMRVLFAIFRYPLAIVVSFVASIVTALYLPYFFPVCASNDDSSLRDFPWFFLIGLAGVGAGSFLIPRNQRWIGSLVLLFLGLGFAFYVLPLSEENSGAWDFFPLVPLGVGGIIPGAIYYLLRNRRLIRTRL